MYLWHKNKLKKKKKKQQQLVLLLRKLASGTRVTKSEIKQKKLKKKCM